MNIHKILANNRDFNKSKANFDSIYTQDDPREYYRVLYGLDYVIPDLAKAVFRQVASALAATRGRRLRVLDLGCSYGVNAALLKYPLDIDRVAGRYRELEFAGLESEAVTGFDRAYFASWPANEIEIVGLDISAPAVRYAEEAGLLDIGVVADLEARDLTPAEAEVVASVDLIISTGCIGYIGERTFARLLAAFGERKPWIASFVLRMFDFAPLESLLDREGFATEKMRGVTFVQRRFHSEGECAQALRQLRARGLDTAGKEEEGLMHAEFFLSRPAGEADDLSLEKLASITSGSNRAFGRRFSTLADDRLRFGR